MKLKNQQINRKGYNRNVCVKVCNKIRVYIYIYVTMN